MSEILLWSNVQLILIGKPKNLKKNLSYMHVKVKQSLCRPITGPEDSRRLRLPYFETFGM